MSLTSSKPLMEHAKKEGYAVPCLNVIDVETLQAIIAAAEIEQSPVMLSVTPATLDFLGIEYFSAMAKVAAEKASVPVAIHLDHGRTFKHIQECIRNGFTSVMIDASRMPFEENVTITKKAIEAAHAVDVTVEAELGKLVLGTEKLEENQYNANMTDPDEAQRFVQETGVDSLAVSVGNAHGVYKHEPKLDLPRVEEIVKKIDGFVVLHGGSGTPRIPEAIKLGVAKVNINADIQVAFRESIKNTIDNNPLDALYAVDMMIPAREAMMKVAQAKMQLFGSSGQASKIFK